MTLPGDPPGSAPRSQRWRAVAVALLVVGVSGVLALPSAQAAREDRRRAVEAAAAEQLAHVAVVSGALLQRAQVERGLTAIYLNGRRPETATSLREARAATDEAARDWEGATDEGDLGATEAVSATTALLADLPERRRATDDGTSSADEMFTWYTELTGAVIAVAANAASQAGGTSNGASTSAYTSLLEATEQLGRERGWLAGRLEAGRADEQETLVTVAGLRAAREEALEVFRLTSGPTERGALAAVERSPEAAFLASVEEAVLAGDAERIAAVEPDEWFRETTTLLDDYAALVTAEEVLVEEAARERAAAEQAAVVRHSVLAAAVLVTGAATGLGLVVVSDRRIRTQARAAARRAADDAARIEALLTGTTDAIVIATAEGVIEHANPVATQVFGYRPDELVGANLSLLMPREVAVLHDGYLGRYAATGELRFVGGIREVTGRRRDGSPVPLEVLVTTMRLGGRTSFTGVLRDVSERHRLSRLLAERASELASKNEALSRSNEELQQFAYVASHDLQEPLRKVASYVEILEADYGDQLDDDAKEYIAYASDGARRMRVLIDDLLALSRVRKERMAVEDCDTGAVVREVVDDLAVAIREAGATVTVGELPVVPGDPVQLRQVFQNLLSNAVKYRADRPPRIEVGAQRDGTDWRFAVQDNGIGFKQEYADQVFGMFQRLVSRRQFEGTGIGLAIVAKIVHNHGGRVWATSEPEVGTTFAFTLPSSATPGELPEQRQPGPEVAAAPA